MASATKKTEIKRKQKIAKKGKVRKASYRNQGTTKSEIELFGDE